MASVPGMLLAHWLPNGTADERRGLLAAAGQIVLLGLGGIIAVIGVALSLARHGQSLLDARSQQDNETTRRGEVAEQIGLERSREEARASEARAQRELEVERDLRARFVAAVELLSAAAPVKRTAGLYALAALGDDWLAFGRPNELQVCIDVMCGYLRSNVTAAERTPAEASVRDAGFQLIASHLTPEGFREDSAWEGRRFPLAGAPVWFTVTLDGISCANGTVLDLRQAEFFSAAVSLNRVTVSRSAAVYFDDLKMHDTSTLHFEDATIESGSLVSLADASLGSRSVIIASRAQISDRAEVALSGIRLEGNAIIDFSEARLFSGGGVTLDDANLGDSSRIDFGHTTVREGAYIGVEGAMLSGSAVLSFWDVTVTSGTISVMGCGVGDGTILCDRMSLTSLAALDLTRTRVVGTGKISIAGAVIGEDALILPNRQAFGAPGVEQPEGSRVTHTELVHTV